MLYVTTCISCDFSCLLMLFNIFLRAFHPHHSSVLYQPSPPDVSYPRRSGASPGIALQPRLRRSLLDERVAAGPELQNLVVVSTLACAELCQRS